MSHLVDTHWVISYLNGRIDAVALFTRLFPIGVSVSSIGCGEVYEGLLSETATEAQRFGLEAFLARVEVIAPDIAIARRYAEIRSYLRVRGTLIGDNDLWIAATALAHDLTLVSRDAHFDRVPGLRVLRQSTP